MGRAAVQLKVGCSESASDLLEASDLVTSATVAGLASTLTPVLVLLMLLLLVILLLLLLQLVILLLLLLLVLPVVLA